MEECLVTALLGRIEALSPEMKYNDLVLLSAVKLLSPKEKTLLFSLMLNNISTQRIRTPPKELLALGAVSVENGYYVLDRKVQSVLLEACARQSKDVFLVKTDQIPSPREATAYSSMLFRTISNLPEGNKLVRKLMVHMEVLQNGEITHKGFNFLLSDRKTQMWSLILSHLSLAQKEEQHEVRVLCEMLSKDPKRVYLLDRTMPKAGVIEVFRSLDLITCTNSKVQFTRAFGFLFDEAQGKKKILTLESNFRMYVYGTNQLNTFIISLFTTKLREFPNLVVAMINEESVRRAFALGITAHQIVAYLSSNALYKIDSNVLNQFSLWETRRKRISKWGVYLFTNFLNLKDYLLVESFCRNSAIQHRSYKEKRMLIVDTDRYEEVKNFIKLNIK